MKKLMIAGMALTLLAGCSTLKRATGQIDDSTLPGQRSEILPPDQQVAHDPNVQGNPSVPGAPANGQIATTPINPPARQQVAGNMQRATAPATGSCDPKVDLCPEPLAPDPVAPVSPVKPVTPMATKGAKPVVAASKTVSGKPVPPGTPPTTVKMASKPANTAQDAADGNLAAGQVLVDPNAPPAAKKSMAAKKPATATVATAPVDGTVVAKPAVKKIVKKKKPVAAASATAPAAPDANAAAPAAPVPQGQ